MRNVSLSKYISKSVHFLTAFVYLFTFLGPSLAIATNTITLVEVIEPERVQTLPTLRLNPREEYQRFDLKITPEKSQLRQGVHFRFQNYDSPEESLGAFVNFNGPFPYSNFSPLIKKDLQTGFTVSLPEFGQIHCDWQGNLKLVGLHTTHPETPDLALNLVTEGTVEFSDVTLANLTLKAKKAFFIKGISLKGDSVFDVKALHIDTSGVENNHTMRFLSKTRLSSSSLWRNTGEIIGEGSLYFANGAFLNSGLVHSKRHLTLKSHYFRNNSGEFVGERSTRLFLKNHFYNSNGLIGSNGSVNFFFEGETSELSLGDIRGQNVVLEDRSGAEHFTLQDGSVTAQERVTLVGNSPEMPNVRFVTPQLVLDADSFDLGEQNDVERTLIMRSKDQDFTLTKDYKTDGTLEIWQRDLYTREDVQEAMDERFGDETGVMPEPESLIDLQASIKAAGGLAFFTPSAKVRLGDAAKEDLREFTSQNGWLEAYATVFDLEKGTLVAENAHVHAPGGILTGRLDKDENEDLFSEQLYRQNGSTFLVRGTATLKGPWHNRGDFLSSFLVLDSPKDHLFEAATGRVLKDCEFKGSGDLYLKRRTSEWHVPSSKLCFVNSDGSDLRISGFLSGHSVLFNNGSVLHAHSISEHVKLRDIFIYTVLDPVLFNPRNIKLGYPAYTTTHSGLKSLLLSHKINTKSDSTIDNHYVNHLPGKFSICLRYVESLNHLDSKTYPAQTSFGTGTTVTPDERGITTIGGDFQASSILVLIGQGSAEVGSLPTVIRQTTPTYRPLQPLVPESINLTVLTMSENLRRLMNQNPEVDTFFRFTPRFWFEPDEAQRFHTELRPYVRVQHPQGGFEDLQGQALFTLTPDMLIKAVQDKALEILGRGNIEDNRKIDEDQVIELHHNFVAYIKDVGLEGADLTQALMQPNSCLPMPKKPFICYESLVNEEGIAELSPIIWLPQEMHKKSGIQTRLLLSIPMGMSFNDLMAHARKNGMLQPALEKLVDQHSHMIPKINQMALKYREDNGFAEDDVLPPMGDITLNGQIRADDFFILNTGNVINHADVKCQDAYLASFFGSVIMSSVVERESRVNGNFQDKILAQARLEASNLIKIFAGKDVIFQGAETVSEVATHILALARIFDIPAVLVSQRTEQLSGKYKGTETWMHIHNHVSKHASNGSLKQEALDSQELCGPQYTADFIDILSEGDIEITDAIDHTSHSFTGKKSSGTRTKKRSEQSHRQTSRGAGFKALKAPTNIESRKGNLGLTAPQFTGGHGATLSAPLGEIMIRLGRESFEKTSSSTMTSSTWNKMVQKSEKHLTFSVPTSDGPVKIKALKTIVENIQGKELELLEKLEVLDGELVKQVVAELHEYDEKVIESLGGPAAAVIAIAVSCITAGAAGPAMIAAMGQVIGSACAAGFASLASQAAVSLISNQGDLGAVVKEITSSQALRSLATSMVTAGLVAGASELINGATKTATSVGESATTATTQSVTQPATQSTVNATTKAFDIGERIQDALIRASAGTFSNTVIGGQDLEDSILAAARSGVTNVAGGFLAHEWGVEYKDIDSQIDYFTHKLVHGIIGAGMGAISDGEALAGFIGATVGEIIGEAYADTHPEGFDQNHEDYDPYLRDSLKKKGEILTQVTSALAAAFLDQNPNVAACTALNAVTENSFATTPILQRQTVEETGEIIGYILENTPAETTEELAGDLYEVLSSLNHLDLSDDQAVEIAISIAGKISEHGDSISGRQLNQFVQKSFLEYVSPTAEHEQFIEDVGNLGQLGGQKASKFLGGSEEVQLLTGELGKLAGTGIAFGMSLYDNPASSGAKKVVKETAKKVAKETTKGKKIVTLSFKDGMEKRSFDRKKKLLQKAGEKGKLRSNKSHGVSPAERRQLTRKYRRDLKTKIDSIYSKNPEARKSALQKLKRSDIDHKIDLQLGGKNTRKNLKTLDSSTNRSLGSQIAQQLPKEKGIEIKIINSKKKGPNL